jgi:outer membrane protein assembly factor BamB
MKAIDGMHRQFGVAAIPQFEPVVVGDTVIFRTLFELRCVSLSTSKTLWKSSVLSGLDTLLPRSGGSGRAASNATLARSLRKWLWDRSVASSLVGDGRRVFAVEDVSPPDGGYLPVMEILPDGTPTLREGSGKTHNRLTAWDVKTGKVLWECGGPVNTRPAKEATATNQANTNSAATKSDLAVPVARSLAGVRFIGAPNPLGNQLCVVGQVEDQIELFLLDSATGQLVSRSTLHMHDEMPVGFMRGFPFGKMNVSPIDATGSAPVLDNDAVFVYVGSNRYVAFDLAAMRILWAYQEKRHEQPRNANIRNFKLVQQFAANQMTRPDRWTTAKPTIVGSRVLITPPVTDLLVCLDRDNGRVLWDVPREDGLFIAGIVDGVAVVVGRSGVRGIRVEDGKPAWTPARIEMPDGVQPAGRGILIPKLLASSRQKTARLHLPQANGNVAVLDIERGRWSTAQWDAAGRVGNLQFGKKTIVSQDSAGITIFDRISNRRERILAKLKKNANDVSALIAAVELALNDSEWSEAIAFATRAVKAGGGQKAEMTLADSHATSLRHLSSDSARAAVSIQAAIDSIELLASNEPKLRLHRAIATAQRENKKPIGALQSWLKIIQSQPGTSSDLRAQSFVWRVREDRQIQAELKELFQSVASDPERAAMTEHLLSFRSENSPDVFIRFFGFHELANQSRLTKAAEHSKKKQWLIAQQLLMSVAKTGSSDEQVTATRLIVELLLERGEIGPAQFYVERLSGRLAKHKDSTGRTGLDIALAILPKIVNPLQGAAAWPEKPTKVEEFKVKSTSKSAQMVAYSLSPELRSDDSQSGTVELDTRLTTLFARDALGKEKWKITLKAAVTSNVRSLRYAVRYNQARYARQGQLTVAWIGDQVCAIDGLTKTGKPLWSKTCFVVNPLDPNSSQFRANIRPQILVHQDAQRLPLLVTSSFVCFQQGRKLLAVDPIDGSTLWWRDDVGSDCDLFGDADFVFARKQGQATATVLRGLDGKKLGTRPVPEISDRVVALGRQCVSARQDGEQYKVTATDLWSQAILWQRSLPKNSHLHVVNTNELALLQPDGQFEIVQTADGNLVASTKLAPVDSLKSLIVQRRLDRFVVIVNEPPKKKNAIRIVQQPVPNQHAVHGEVYILSNDGKQVAQTRIEDHSIKLNQPEGLPFVIFFHRYQNQKVLPNGGRTSNRPKTKVALLDVRSGNKVYESDREFGYDSDYRLAIDPAKKQIELTTRSDGLRVSYAEP